jgi:hypothetical protein
MNCCVYSTTRWTQIFSLTYSCPMQTSWKAAQEVILVIPGRGEETASYNICYSQITKHLGITLSHIESCLICYPHGALFSINNTTDRSIEQIVKWNTIICVLDLPDGKSNASPFWPDFLKTLNFYFALLVFPLIQRQNFWSRRSWHWMESAPGGHTLIIGLSCGAAFQSFFQIGPVVLLLFGEHV